ncbi:MAG TPA: acyltransferase [Gaiellaceae bacterium]|nr:acyltransferase [Gaiellaceae bacterium]
MPVGPSANGRDLRLDGIRGIAVLLVLLYHVGIPVRLLPGGDGLLPGGWVGVDVFFVLSGYLITRLLLRERETTGRIRLGAFYDRRVRRLGPALVVLLAVWLFVTLPGLLLVQRLGSGAYVDTRLAFTPVIGSFTLLYNWVLALDHPTPVGMGHLWTLSVEEQFYLVWPTVILVFTAHRKHPERLLWRMVLAGIALSLVLSTLDRLSGERDLAYFGSLTGGLGLLVGAGTALRVPALSRGSIGAAGLLTILGCAVLVPDTRPDLLPWATVATCVATAAIISCSGPRLDRFLTVRWLRYTGKRSYALYLWSSPLAYATVLWGGRTWQMSAVVLVASFVFAELSWQLVERRFVAARTTAGEPPVRTSGGLREPSPSTS